MFRRQRVTCILPMDDAQLSLETQGGKLLHAVPRSERNRQKAHADNQLTCSLIYKLRFGWLSDTIGQWQASQLIHHRSNTENRAL